MKTVEWLWLIPLNVALLIVPAMFGVWAWLEVIERIREDHAAIGHRTRVLRLALVATSATYLVGAGTWVHPATIEFVLNSPIRQRLMLYALVAIPWIAFGTIGLLARTGRRTGIRGFLQERARQVHRVDDAQERSRAFLHAIGIELEGALREIQMQVEQIDQRAPVAAGARGGASGEAVGRLRHLAVALQIPMPPAPSDVALDECLADRLERVRPIAEERGVSVFRTGIEGARVYAGPKRLRQILQVLLEGAMERAPRGEGLVVITVRQKPHSEEVQLTISDNGRSLSDAELARAFTLDTHTHAGMRPTPGLGFPLAVARRLARQDGGDLHIAPGGGGGTVLALLLPLSDATPGDHHGR